MGATCSRSMMAMRIWPPVSLAWACCGCRSTWRVYRWDAVYWGHCSKTGACTPAPLMARVPLARGKLVPLFEDWQVDPMPLHVAFPPSRHVSRKLRVFIDWVVELL